MFLTFGQKFHRENGMCVNDNDNVKIKIKDIKR